MSSLTCPKCHGDMRSYERNGVTVDQCGDCRGIFLDRGELEHLIAADSAAHAPSPARDEPRREEPRREEPRHDDRRRDDHYRDDHYRDDRYRDDRYREGSYKKKRKEHWLEDLFG